MAAQHNRRDHVTSSVVNRSRAAGAERCRRWPSSTALSYEL